MKFIIGDRQAERYSWVKTLASLLCLTVTAIMAEGFPRQSRQAWQLFRS